METLRNEVYQLQRELLQERTKVRALSEELENPMNVHRWRKLEGSDPATYELVQKIHMLQKRLIDKSEEVCRHRPRAPPRAATQAQPLPQCAQPTCSGRHRRSGRIPRPQRRTHPLPIRRHRYRLLTRSS